MNENASELNPAFTDAQGRRWHLRLNYALATDLQEKVGVDVRNALKTDGWLKLYDDPSALLNCLWILCEEKAKNDGVTQRSFFEGFEGETFDGALNAFLDAVVFFSRDRERPVIQAAVEKIRQQDQTRMDAWQEVITGDKMTAHLQKVTEQAKQKVEAKLQAETRKLTGAV